MSIDWWELVEPEVNEWTTDYFRRICISRYHIRERLTNPGGSIILRGRAPEVLADADPLADMSAVIGNDFHLDLLSAEDVLRGLPASEVKNFLQWCDGLPTAAASMYLDATPTALRKRRERLVRRGVDQLNETRAEGATGTRGRRAPSGRSQASRGTTPGAGRSEQVETSDAE